MRKLLLLLVASVPVTIILVIIAGALTEFSIWESRATLFFFPYAMIVRAQYKPGESIPLAVNYALFLQVPLYSLMIGMAWMKWKLKFILAVLLLLHAAAAGFAIKLDASAQGKWGVCCPENKR